ncbi:type II secretion system protein [bacterium]|nr:type II secretion system protein [bacterium]
MKKYGFTLAEVLITLGIIGVVAALTIPTLMQEQRNKEYVSRFQKAWGLLNNAIKISEAHNGFIKTWGPTNNYDDTELFMDKYFAPYFNIAKNCKLLQNQGCWAQKTTYINGNETSYNDNLTQYKMLLNDGMSLNFVLAGYPIDQVHIAVDTNGPKGPNIGGRDIFKFALFLNSGQISPMQEEDKDKTLSELKERCLTGTSLPSCGAYLVKNGYKMDY